MTPHHHLPADIERTSLSIITAELETLGLTPPPETAAVVKRVIHTTADFDYARNLRFTPGAVAAGVAALRAGTPIVTDTNMALAGITRPGLAKVGSAALCYMADPEVAAAAKAAGTTRAVASMHRAAQEHPGAILAVGNAPTALLTIAEEIEAGLRPALVIGVPVGFVNVVESKETLFAACEAHGVPAIAAMGRKGGSNVAAAICNALVYSAAEMLDPTARGWKLAETRKAAPLHNARERPLFALHSKRLRAVCAPSRFHGRGTLHPEASIFIPRSRSWPGCGAYPRRSHAAQPYSRRTAAAAR